MNLESTPFTEMVREDTFRAEVGMEEGMSGENAVEKKVDKCFKINLFKLELRSYDVH